MEDAEVLLELWKGTGARVTERRNYEWKIAFGLWTAQLASTSVILLNADQLEVENDLWWKFLLAGLALSALHAVYVFCFVRQNNHHDSALARAYEQDLHKLLGDDRTVAVRNAFKPAQAKAPYSPANFFAVGVTIFLTIVSAFAMSVLAD